ncbi:MAG: hypothetical protein IPP51_05895 [Bacteroidetes bacterium]|nr:hypothetical protein [Bacteroidota bacterium]
MADGVVVSTAGTFTSHISNASGCDSTITTNLTVIPNTSSTQNVSICAGSSHALADGVVVSTAGTFVSHIPNAAGCDSTVTTNLTVIPNTSSTQNVSICAGSSHTLADGVVVSTAGTFVSHISNAAGCDSTITTNLTVLPNTSSTQNISICAGSTHTLADGVVVSNAGTYTSHISNTAGCDSTITTNVTVIPNTSSSQVIAICTGSSHTLPDGVVVTAAGAYTSHISNAAGCDSTISTQITIIPAVTSSVNETICQGSTFTLPDGNVVSSPGAYTVHLTCVNGCDSAVTTFLNVMPATSSSASATICQGDSYTLPDGDVVGASGTFVSHVLNMYGCDSTITTTITVTPTSSSSEVITICQGSSYTLPSGAIVSAAGSYTSTLPAENGCDSIITTSLIVTPNSYSTITASICSGSDYTLADGVVVNTSGTYTSILANANGCDSIITTALTVLAPSARTDSVTICAGAQVTLPDNSTVNPVVTTSYMIVLPNAGSNGCDSIITTVVTVNSVPTLLASPTQIQCFGGKEVCHFQLQAVRLLIATIRKL